MSKIAAACVTASGGVHTVVTSGFDVSNIQRIFAGDDIGTLVPAALRPNKRQCWLAYATTATGTLKVNCTACFAESASLQVQDDQLQLEYVIMELKVIALGQLSSNKDQQE